MPAEFTITGSWVDGTLHVWGWDGQAAVPPNWLQRAFERPPWSRTPFAHGRVASIELVLPGGRALRPPTVRLDSDAVAGWLRSIGPTTRAADSLAWFAAVGHLAESTVTAGLVTPIVRVERGLRVARWLPLADPTLDAALDGLAAAAPPVCLPRSDETVASVHATLVDGVARHRLADRSWRPSLPAGRAPGVAGVRAVCRALAGADPLLRAPSAQDGIDAIAEVLDRRRRRAAGEPVVLPRLRLVVPDDPLDDWEVRLEVVDEVDPGRWCTADDVWDASPLAVEVAGGVEHVPLLREAVGDLATQAADAVDVLGELAHAHEPASVVLDLEAADRFLEQGPAELDRLGIELLGPERLVRAGVAVRGRATPAPPSERAAGLGREALVEWSLSVTDDDGPAAITEAELARAEAAGRHPAPQRSPLGAHRPGGAAAGTAAGRGAPSRRRRRRRRRPAPPRRRAPVDGGAGLDRCASSPGCPTTASPRSRSPPRSPGRCGRTNDRGLGWLRFLARLGLGGCLADDMGLGKTATTLAHLLDRPGSAPRRLPAVGGPQLGGRGGAVHAHAARRRAPRRRAVGTPSTATIWPAPTSSSRRTACSRATSTTSRPSPGRRWWPTRPR